VRRLASELGLQHVTFVGRVPPEDIWRYYAEADIYLQTPNIDNMPTSVLEAYASGCPVVATNAGGVPAILTDGQHGLLVPCDDHQAAAAAMCRVIEDPALARRLTDSALESCARYQWSAVRSQWVALYRRMVGPAVVPAATPA
jgi:glycosyltransferase involved in cell wall biosynthesis